jgi:dTDP-4-amino-4,6-dideoxygalactose transaminase
MATMTEGIMEPIPILDLRGEIESLWEPITQAIQRVLRSGQFIFGPEVEAFEREAAAFLKVKHAVGCNSGTDALLLALRAIGIGPGDEVITTAFTFVATSEAIVLAGATPVFVDIDPRTLNIDAGAIEAAITPRTKAILPVHLFGHAADMDAILAVAQRHNLKVLEDVAQAFGGTHRGRMLGSLGTAGAFSFFPTKNLGAIGDAGLLTTNDDEIARLARMLRVHGSARRYYHEMVGYNSRLDALQAAVLRVKLPHLPRWNEGRRAAGRMYAEHLAGLDWIQLPHEADYARHIYHQYTIRIVGRDRDAVQQHLARQGITTMLYYPVPTHQMPAYSPNPPKLPHTDEAAKQVLSLPIGWDLSEAKLQRIAEALRGA